MHPNQNKWIDADQSCRYQHLWLHHKESNTRSRHFQDHNQTTISCCDRCHDEKQCRESTHTPPLTGKACCLCEAACGYSQATEILLREWEIQTHGHIH